MNRRPGVSFVVPVHNGAAWIGPTLQSILAQADGRPTEIIVVDDGGDDRSSDLLESLATSWPLRVIKGHGAGAAAALNIGVRAARFPIICQVDQDVVLGPDWMRALVARFDDPDVAAVQGYYAHDPDAGFYARIMGLDLEQRYAAIAGRETGHVCTGNAAYRADALRRVGLFDDSLGYGYDNDMSYRLQAAGHRLAFCRDARSLHRWRDGLRGYLTQQYGFGYGRLDVVAKHPNRFSGDSVSPPGMMAHALFMCIAAASLPAALVLSIVHGPWRVALLAAAAMVAGLALERVVAGVRAAWRFRSLTPLSFPVLHLARDLAWVVAVGMWSLRRITKRRRLPSHSMYPRATPTTPGVDFPQKFTGTRLPESSCRSPRVLGLIPAHNEKASLPSVIAELRVACPDLDLLVIDDGSTDDTVACLDRLDVRWLRFPERMGIGSAMRAGLRYAVRFGHEAAVRIDGDGQHRADDIDRLLAPIREGAADVVLGSRYSLPRTERAGLSRLAQRLLGACISAQIGRRVTDPTSGFCALGRRAIHLLAEHHPTGYPEPELRLFLSRNALDVVEVPVEARSRLAGVSSLTPMRMTIAGARVLLAMIVVPLRCAIDGLARD